MTNAEPDGGWWATKTDSMIRRVIISLLLIVALGAVGASIWHHLISTKAAPPTVDLERPALLVETTVLTPQTLVEPVIGFGTARADRQAWIAAQVAGEVVEVSDLLHVGRAVEAGTLLVQVDARDYERQLERAQAALAAAEAELAQLDIERKNVEQLIEIAESELDIAQREYERVLGLFESKQAPRRELDIARQAAEAARRVVQQLQNQLALLPQQRIRQEAQVQSQRAEVALAELALERCEIVAPFDGRIEAVEIDIGERVNVGTQLFALLDPQQIEVPIELPVSLRDRVQAGAGCRLSLESNPAAVWSGAVARIAPKADENTRTFSMYVEIDNDEQETPLMPGMFVRAHVDGPTLRDVFVVPRGVIQQDHIYVWQDGIALRQPIEVDRLLLDQAVIRGVEPGQRVIISNLDALYDQAHVRLRDTAASRAEVPAAEPTP